MEGNGGSRRLVLEYPKCVRRKSPDVVTGGDDDSVRVQLARMEGKLDMGNLRHDQTDQRLNNHEQRLHRHSSDISNLQSANLVRETQTKTLAASGRIVWAGIGLIPGGAAVAVLMRLFGT